MLTNWNRSNNASMHYFDQCSMHNDDWFYYYFYLWLILSWFRADSVRKPYFRKIVIYFPSRFALFVLDFIFFIRLWIVHIVLSVKLFNFFLLPNFKLRDSDSAHSQPDHTERLFQIKITNILELFFKLFIIEIYCNEQNQKPNRI